MATLTDEQRKENLKLAISTRQGVATAIADLSAVNSRILVAARKSAGENWRAAVGAMAKWRSSMLSGDIASARRAMVDIAKLRLAEAPVDNDMLVRVQDYLANNAATAGAEADSGIVQRAAWQQFIRLFPDATSNETTYGTYRAMENLYGAFQDSYVADNTTLKRNWDGIRNKVEAQGDAIEITQGYATAIEQGMGGLAPEATADEAQSVLSSIESKYAPGKISPRMAAIERMAAAAPSEIQLTPEERSEFEANQKTMAQLRAQLSAPLGEMPTAQDGSRDKLARLVASERFQWWAERNGFDIGVVHPATEGREYADGVVTPVGVYVPGPDDRNAMRFLATQMRANKSENAVVHPILHRRLNNEKRAYGVVQIDQPVSSVPVEDAERFRIGAVGRVYRWFEDKQTGSRYDMEQSLIFVRDDDNGTLSAWTPEEYWAGATQEARDDFEAASRKGTLSWDKDGVFWYRDIENKATVVPPEDIQAAFGVHREPPMVITPNPPLEVYGEFLAPTSDDPVGSVRMRTKDGDRVFTQDEIAVAPVVTTGSGPRQTLARFVELSRGRMAHNKAEKNAYEAEGKGAPVTPQPADRAAEAVIPDKYSEQERKRNEARNLKQADTEEAQERAARELAQKNIRAMQQAEYTRVYQEVWVAVVLDRQGDAAAVEQAAKRATERADALLTPALVESQLRAARGIIRGTRPDAFDGAGGADERAVSPETVTALTAAVQEEGKRNRYDSRTVGLRGADQAPLQFGALPGAVAADPNTKAHQKPGYEPPQGSTPLRNQETIADNRADAVDRRTGASAGTLGMTGGGVPPVPPVPPAPPVPPKTEAKPPVGTVDEVRVVPPTGSKGAGQAPLPETSQGEAPAVQPPPASPPVQGTPPAPQGRMPPMPTPESEERARREKEAAEAIEAGQVDARRARATNLPAYEAPDTGAPETRYSVGAAPRKPPMFSVQGLLRRRGQSM